MTLPSSVLQSPKFVEDLQASKKSVDHSACLRLAMNSEKNIAKQIWEWVRLSRTGGCLSQKEYFMYGLFDDRRYTFEQKREFVGDQFYFQIIGDVCDRRWWILADDKFLSYQFFANNDFPVPETQAVVCVGPRSFGKTRKVCGVDDLKSFLLHEATFPIYSKPIDGIGSFANFLIESYEDSQLKLHDDSTMSVEDFIEQGDSQCGQLLQSVLRPHPELSDVSQRVSTIRVIMIIRDGKPQILSTIWKVASDQNVADNFWRLGNRLADVDFKTGTVSRLVGYRDGVPEVIAEDAAEAQSLIGRTLPDWDQAMELCRRGAMHFPPMKFLSWDIALTDAGPVIVELNPGSSFVLPQLASGKGFLTDDFHAFLKDCGCKLKDRKS